MPELERWVLHRLAELDEVVREGYARMISKACSARSFISRRLICRRSTSISARTRCIAMATRCAPRGAHGAGHSVPPPDHMAGADAGVHDGRGLAGAVPGRGSSVHLQDFPETPTTGGRCVGGEMGDRARVRRVVTAALEVQRRDKVIGASLEAAPSVHVRMPMCWRR